MPDRKKHVLHQQSLLKYGETTEKRCSECSTLMTEDFWTSNHEVSILLLLQLLKAASAHRRKRERGSRMTQESDRGPDYKTTWLSFSRKQKDPNW